jgi:uncharacterized damage-inducible protein DinB
MTHAKLNQSFLKLEKQRNDLFKQLQVYDGKVLNQRPIENAWSAMEVLKHLQAAEDFSCQYLEKKTKDPESAIKTGLKEKFRSIVLNAYLGSSKKFKSPEVALPSEEYTPLSKIRADWDAVRKNLQDIWSRLPEDMLDRNWFKHPVAGKLNLMQMISFMEAHFSRHEKQIGRILKQLT